MNRFLKSGLGLLAITGLASGSLFAFNISTSIDNALQVIKTIWVTSDGTTNNPPFVTIDGASGYVSIGTSGANAVFNMAGTFDITYNDSYGYNALMGYNDPWFGGGLGFLYGGANTTTIMGIMPGSSGIDKVGVMINIDSPNTASSMAVEPGSVSMTRSIDTSNTIVNQLSINDTGVIVTVSGNQSFWFTKDRKFGARTNNPGNTIDIAQTAIPGTLGLRLASGTGSSGQILGVNGDGDVVMLGNIGGFGGGGGPNYWTQNGNNLYPTTLANKVGIGTNNPLATLGVSGSVLIKSDTNRGREFLTESLYSGIQNIGGWFASGSQLWHQGVAITDGPLSYLRRTDNSNNNEMIAQINEDGAALKYSDDRQVQSIGQTFSNVIGLARDELQIMFDMYNFNGYRNGISIDQDGLFYENDNGPIHAFTRNGNVGINNINPYETLEISGTVLSSFTSPYGTFGLVGNNTIFGGTPGAGGYASSGSEFVFAGVDHDGSKLSAELAYTDGNISQFITVSNNGPAMLWQSTIPTLHRNGLHVTSTGIESFIIDPLLIGPGAFTWTTDNGNELMRLTNSNRLGIGTSNPQKALDVSGAMVSSILTLTSGDALSGNAPYFFFVPDVQNANTIAMQPGSGEIYVIMGFANGSPGQEIRVIGTNIPLIGTYIDIKGNEVPDTSTNRLVTMMPHYQDTLSNIINILGAPLTTRQIFMQRFDTLGNDTSQENSGGTYIAGCSNETSTSIGCFLGAEFVFDGTYRYPTARF